MDDNKMKVIEDYLFWYRREIDQKLSPTLAGRIYLDHIEYLLSKIEELEKRLHKAAGDISFWREQQNDSCKRVKELEKGIEKVLKWRGLDGDGISDPLREELYELIRGEEK